MSSLISPAGVVGACIGALVGWINFRIVTGITVGKLRGLDRSANEAERAEFEGKIVLLRRIVFVATVPVIAGVGYFFGRTLGG
ncbi:MAG: hypothetical protein WCH83_13050 [Alphaproteobacteria bacterium]|jgi:hypothetical protein